MPFLIPSDIAEMQSAANGMIILYMIHSTGFTAGMQSHILAKDEMGFGTGSLAVSNSVYLGSKGPQDEDTGLPSNGVPIKIHMYHHLSDH